MAREIFIDDKTFKVSENANVIMIRSKKGNDSIQNREYEIVDVFPDETTAMNKAFMHFLNLNDDFVVKDNSIVDDATNDVKYTYGDKKFEYFVHYYINYVEKFEHLLNDSGTSLSTLLENHSSFEKMNDPQILFDGDNGIYIPQKFYEFIESDNEFNLNIEDFEEEWDDISDPENEFYNESWDSILRMGIVEDTNTKDKYVLDYNDFNDLILVPYE